MGKKIWLSAPAMCGKEIGFINQAFDENWIAPLGSNVTGFENEACEYLGAENAVAMTTGTSAIHMALRYLGVSSGDIVFCSSLTFAASCNPIKYQNAVPVFIDSEPESWNMSPTALKKAFDKYPKPKAVIVVNLYGQSADFDKILEICNSYDVPVIEDAAESLGATYMGKMTGTFGKFGAFSFNGNKIITTSSGGMLICPDEISKKKILNWITQNCDDARHCEHSELGYNYRLSNICAGIGRGQLTVLSERIKKKKKIYYAYKETLSDIDMIEFMPVCEYGEPNYWLSCFTIKDEKKVNPTDVITALESENIESRPVWKPMHLQPIFKDCDYFMHDYDVSADIFNRGLCLPSDVNMNNKDMERITAIVRRCF